MKKIGFKDSRKTIDNYFLWRKDRSLPAVNRVNKIKILRGKKILDIGCGYGALCEVLNEFGADVYAVDTDRNKVAYARKRLANNKNIRITTVRDEILSFSDNSFDVIFLFDVIEHINRPDITINECFRVLKKKGLLYVEFTPYYSVTGHHLYDFAKWPIHILPKNIIKKYIFSKPVEGFITHDDFWQQFESLNKLTIGRFQELVTDFKEVEVRYIVKYPEVFEINIPVVKFFGPFKDLFTISFEGIYRK